MILLGIALAAALLAGCGGSGNSGVTATGTRAGSLTLTVKWPAPGRFIPVAANSIKADVVQVGPNTIVASKLIARPTGAPTTSSVMFDSVPVGDVVLIAHAFPDADGTGTAQAAGVTPAKITGGQTTTVTVTMATLVDHLRITPDSPTINVGETKPLTMTAYNPPNEVVLTAPQNVKWTSADPSVATVDATGNVKGIAKGSAVITVTESESKQSASTTVAVVAVSSGGCMAGPVTGPGVAPTSAWPRFGGHGNQNQCLSPGGTPQAHGMANWTAPTASGGNSVPVLGPTASGSDGTLYVGTYLDHRVYAFNSTSGALLWKSPDLGSGIVSTAAIGANGVLYIGTANAVCALNTADGSVTWTVPADNPRSAAIGGDGTIYVPVNNHLLALDKTAGATKWSFKTGSPLGGIGAGVAGAPALAVSDGTIYFSGQDGNVYALDPMCGTQKWMFPIGAQYLSHPSISVDGGWLFVHAQLKVYALNPVSGAKLWDADVEGGGGAVPAVTSTNGVIVMGGTGSLYSFDGTTGMQNWKFSGGNPNALGQAVAIAQTPNGDVIYFAATGSTQKLFAVDASNGKKQWEYVGPMASVMAGATPIVGSSGNIYFCTQDGIVTAIK